MSILSNKTKIKITIHHFMHNFSIPITFFLCFLESRQRGRFAGFSLYISNSEDRDDPSLCFKDGPALPPLNFTTTCTLSGRYVIFYNERLDGVTYPVGYEAVANVYMELCEVTVNGKLRKSESKSSLGLCDNTGFLCIIICS